MLFAVPEESFLALGVSRVTELVRRGRIGAAAGAPLAGLPALRAPKPRLEPGGTAPEPAWGTGGSSSADFLVRFSSGRFPGNDAGDRGRSGAGRARQRAPGAAAGHGRA